MNLNQDPTYYNFKLNLKKARIIINLYRLRNTHQCVASILNIDSDDVQRTTSLYNFEHTIEKNMYNIKFFMDENETINAILRDEQLQHLNKYNLLELQQKLVEAYDLRIEPIKFFDFNDFASRAFLYMQLLKDFNIQHNIQHINNNSSIVITLII